MVADTRVGVHVYNAAMRFEFSGELWYWRGPAPFHFVSLPEEACEVIRAEAGLLTYGWGMIPVRAGIGATEWKTSMWPKDDGYILPVKAAIRKAERIAEGDVAYVRLSIGADVG